MEVNCPPTMTRLPSSVTATALLHYCATTVLCNEGNKHRHPSYMSGRCVTRNGKKLNCVPRMRDAAGWQKTYNLLLVTVGPHDLAGVSLDVADLYTS